MLGLKMQEPSSGATCTPPRLCCSAATNRCFYFPFPCLQPNLESLTHGVPTSTLPAVALIPAALHQILKAICCILRMLKHHSLGGSHSYMSTARECHTILDSILWPQPSIAPFIASICTPYFQQQASQSSPCPVHLSKFECTPSVSDPLLLLKPLTC